MVENKAPKDIFESRWGNHEDIPAISALAEVVWRKHYPAIISHGQIDYMLEKFYSLSALRAQMENGHQFLLLQQAQAISGFLSIECQDKVARDYFIHKFYVHPNLWGKGAAAFLFRGAMAEKKPHLVALSVNRKNAQALRFYEKQGFYRKEEKNTDIGAGFWMEDYVMERVSAQLKREPVT